MSRFFAFVLGVAVGAFGYYAAQNYHVVRANDGFHVIPKTAPRMGEIYVDIRQFDLSDWNDHKSLALAIVRAEKSSLLKDSAGDSLNSLIDGMAEVINGTESPCLYAGE